VDAGSFFNFFEKGPDAAEVSALARSIEFHVAECASQLGITIANEVFPEAIEYFLGQAGGDEEMDSDDEDEDEEDEEIDLEKPRSKQKV